MKSERRSSERYETQSDEIQVMTEPSSHKPRIKDISKEGLALEYTPLEGEPLDFVSVDIVSRDPQDIFLHKINCKNIYDIETLMEGQTYTGGKRRTRGIKFIELTNEQEENLDMLMKRCFESLA
jgi:hypothetical protein